MFGSVTMFILDIKLFQFFIDIPGWRQLPWMPHSLSSISIRQTIVTTISRQRGHQKFYSEPVSKNGHWQVAEGSCVRDCSLFRLPHRGG